MHAFGSGDQLSSLSSDSPTRSTRLGFEPLAIPGSQPPGQPLSLYPLPFPHAVRSNTIVGMSDHRRSTPVACSLSFSAPSPLYHPPLPSPLPTSPYQFAPPRVTQRMDPFGSDGLFEGVIRQGLGHRGPGSEISCQDWIFLGFACLRTVQFLAVQEYHVFVPLLMNWEAVQVFGNQSFLGCSIFCITAAQCRRRTNMLGTVHRMLLIKMAVPGEPWLSVLMKKMALLQKAINFILAAFTCHAYLKYFLFHPSHRIFRRMHEALNVKLKDDSTTMSLSHPR